MKPIRIESGIIVYYGNRVGRVSDGRAVVDPMFEGPELIDFLTKQRNIREVQWTDGMFDRLMSAPRDAREMEVLKNCRIWQLKPDVDIRMKFVSYDELCKNFGSPDLENYQQVYDGAVETNDLAALYTKFYLDYPASYTGHIISMSDVLELYDESGSTFHYARTNHAVLAGSIVHLFLLKRNRKDAFPMKRQKKKRRNHHDRTGYPHHFHVPARLTGRNKGVCLGNHRRLLCRPGNQSRRGR